MMDWKFWQGLDWRQKRLPLLAMAALLAVIGWRIEVRHSNDHKFMIERLQFESEFARFRCSERALCAFQEGEIVYAILAGEKTTYYPTRSGEFLRVP